MKAFKGLYRFTKIYEDPSKSVNRLLMVLKLCDSLKKSANARAVSQWTFEAVRQKNICKIQGVYKNSAKVFQRDVHGTHDDP